MGHKRRQDTWNERAEMTGKVLEVEADQYIENVAHNKEGISAQREKFILDETTTPKVLPSNKRG